MKKYLFFIVFLSGILFSCSSSDPVNQDEPVDSGDPADSGGSDDSSGSDNNQANDPEITVSTVSNPDNVLSVYVNWTTEEPMDSEVQFGKEEYEYTIYDSAPVTDHRVFVFGMHAETRYLIKAISSNGETTVEDEAVWTSGSLPVGVPEGVVLTDNRQLSQAGWTLMNIKVGASNINNGLYYPSTVVMYDQDGLPVWYYINGSSFDLWGGLATEMLDNKNILISSNGFESPREVDLAGNVIWQGPSAAQSDGILNHDIQKLSNGNYLLLRDIGTLGNYTDVRLEEVTAGNEIVWEWYLSDFVTPPDGALDWCHPNAMTVDPVNDEVYLSCRWEGLFKTTYNSPELIWHMEAAYNESGMGDIDFFPSGSQFSDIHDPEIQDDGTILIFDNGGWDNHQGGEDFHSRILKYIINEDTKTAELIWEFPGNFEVAPWFRNDFYCPYWGDANRLDNGNILVTAGVEDPGNISRIFEVTEDGEIVWDFALPDDYGVYRASRVKVPFIERLQENI